MVYSASTTPVFIGLVLAGALLLGALPAWRPRRTWSLGLIGGGSLIGLIIFGLLLFERA